MRTIPGAILTAFSLPAHSLFNGFKRLDEGRAMPFALLARRGKEGELGACDSTVLQINRRVE